MEKGLVEDPTLPITTYNYSAIGDRLMKNAVTVSLPTIIERAKRLDCYQPHPRLKAHDREVIITAIGTLIQHDASHHRWSPYAEEKWVLITSIDDYGIPLRYYVDSLRVFRFVQDRDSFWRKHVLETDDAEPQWRQTMRILGVDVTHALTPQAKGKVERPYRWLQDRIVRTCAIEKLSTIDEARGVLKEELNRYSNRQVHSTTGEIPSMRFENAKKEGNSLFRPFALPKPYTRLKMYSAYERSELLTGIEEYLFITMR